MTNIGYVIFTSEVTGEKKSNLKNAPRDPIFGMYTNMIFLTNKDYGILTQNSLDAAGGQTVVTFEKNTKECNFGYTYSYDIKQCRLYNFDSKYH